MVETSIIFGNDTDILELAYTASATSPLVEFIGYALPGTATSDAKWRIKKMTYDADGNVTKIQWGFNTAVSTDHGGSFRKVLVFDDRATYTYQ